MPPHLWLLCVRRSAPFIGVAHMTSDPHPVDVHRAAISCPGRTIKTSNNFESAACTRGDLRRIDTRDIIVSFRVCVVQSAPMIDEKFPLHFKRIYDIIITFKYNRNDKRHFSHTDCICQMSDDLYNCLLKLLNVYNHKISIKCFFKD